MRNLVIQKLYCFIQKKQPATIMKQQQPRFREERQHLDSEDWLYNMITSNVLPQLHVPLDESLFDTDLILKIQLPKPSQTQISKEQDMGISALIRNPPQQLSNAYQKAYEKCFPQQQNYNPSRKNNPKTKILLNNFISFDHKQCEAQKKRLLKDADDNQEQLILNCKYQFNGKIDLFLIKYNALIYTLQRRCGFKVKSFLTHDMSSRRFIYLFITQTIPNMLKVAEKYKIKKEIDYPQIDLFLNDPTGGDDRPLKFNTNIIHEIQSKIAKKQQGFQDNYKKTKNIVRYLNGLQPRDTFIIEENQPSRSHIDAYLQFEKEHQEKIHQIMQEDLDLSPQQKTYLYEFNRCKINKGVEKQFINIKKKRKYFDKLTQLAYNRGYTVRSYDNFLGSFTLAARKKSFFDRLRSILLYKQQIISPFGDLFLFVKAERIKLCFLALKEYIRIQHLTSIKAQLFALHNDFDKDGTLGQIFDERVPIPQIKGGLNGKNLIDSWSILMPWKSDLLTLKNYLGESITYQIYVKNHLILHFLVISPLAIAGELLRKIYLESKIKQQGNYLIEFIYYLIFFTISHTIFCIFYELWVQKQNFFLENYTEKQIAHNFRYDFSGPFVRNPISDSVNEHQITLSLFTRFKQFLFLGILACILGGQMGIFYGIRLFIVAIDSQFPNIDYYIISPPHLIPYFVFFAFNQFFYYFIIGNLVYKMTEWENLPTETAFKKSFNAKSIFFLLAIQLIGPIFLLFIQPLGRNNCYSQFCYTEFKLYIYSRHVIIFFFIICKAVMTFYFQLRSRYQKNLERSERKQNEKYQFADYFSKLTYFLGFAEFQSQKKEIKMNMIDQTLSLFHHGIFMASFPLSSVFALLRMLIDYGIQRTQLLHLNRRTFGVQEKISLYSYKYNMVLHMSIMMNCWIVFFSLEDVEYQFQKLIQAIQYPPSYSTIITIKVILILAAIVFYELLAFIIKIITKSNSMYEMHQRQTNKYDEFLKRALTLNSKNHIVIQKPYPIKYIFRTMRQIPKGQCLQTKIQGISTKTEPKQFASYSNIG